jgi:hypothetical protein
LHESKDRSHHPEAVNSEEDSYLTTLEQVTLPMLKNTLTFALETRIKAGKADYRTLVAQAELCAMTSTSPQEVRQAYHRALLGTRRTQFRMQSALRQLKMIQELELQELCLEAGIQELQAELELSASEKGASTALREMENGNLSLENQTETRERKVFLFSGDTGSASSRPSESWQEEYGGRIQCQIEELFASQQVVKGDQVLVITTGMASATEILFVEYCVKQGFSVQAYLPGSKEDYLKDYVWHDCDWEERFENLCNNNLVDDYYQDTSIVPLKQTEKGQVFERNTRWAKYYAQVYGQEYRHLIVVNPEEGSPQIKFASMKNRNPSVEETRKSRDDP